MIMNSASFSVLIFLDGDVKGVEMLAAFFDESRVGTGVGGGRFSLNIHSVSDNCVRRDGSLERLLSIAGMGLFVE
jgi:hypothetical protein